MGMRSPVPLWYQCLYFDSVPEKGKDKNKKKHFISRIFLGMLFSYFKLHASHNNPKLENKHF
jgi:hypothetical protein